MSRNINLYGGSNSLDIEIRGLKNSVSGDYIVDAIVTATIYEEDGTTEVSGVTWPVSMSYIAASNGNYSGTVDSDSEIVIGSKYKVVVSATDLEGNKGEWIENSIAKRRRFT